MRPYKTVAAGRHGYAKAYLRQRFRDQFGGDHPPDWRVDTTFVAPLQDAAEAAVEAGLAELGEPELQAALVAIDPATGDVLALVGGRDFQRSAFNRASRAGGSRARPSSRSCSPRRSSAACRRCRGSTASSASRRRAPTNGRRVTSATTRPTRSRCAPR